MSVIKKVKSYNNQDEYEGISQSFHYNRADFHWKFMYVEKILS